MLKQVIIFVWMLFSLHGVWAVNVANLYQVNVAVSDHSQAKRKQAFGVGLKQVLIKVTGDPNLTTQGVKKSFTTKPSNYVRRYSYQQDDDQQWHLSVTFDKPAIDHKLKQMGQASLGAERPSILMWLAMSQAGTKSHIINPSQTPLLATPIQELANEYALPIQFPLLDLMDNAFMTTQAIAHNDFALIEQASQRYGSAAVLMGNMTSFNSRWQGDWTLRLAGQVQTWVSRADTSAALIKALMANVLERVAQRYAVIESLEPADSLHVSLAIENVSSMADYANVVTFIKSIDFVQQVVVKSVDQEKMFLNVTIQGRLQDLVEAIKLSQKFSIQPQQSDEMGEEDTLILYWKASSV